VSLCKIRSSLVRHESDPMPSGVPALSPPSLPSGEQSGIGLARPSALFAGVASRFGGRSRLNGPRYILLWQTVAIVASMLIFASLRSATTDVTGGDTTRSTILNFGSKELGRTVSGTRSQQMGVSKTAEAQLRKSDNFVAKDFTNHFNLHAQSIATVQKSELTRTGQGSVSHKRVVLN
jgi:hypothetical protein